jgi:hypothetical protein
MPEDPKPYFIPPGMQFDKLPPELQAAIRAIVDPNYEEMVLKAEAGVERSAGMSVSFLEYLEVLCQMELSHSLAELDSDFRLSREQHEKIGKCLRLKAAKDNGLKLIQRMREFRARRRPCADPGGLRPASPSSKSPTATSLGGEDGKTQ